MGFKATAVEDQLQRRIELFLRGRQQALGTKTEGSVIALGTSTGAVRKDNQDRAIVIEGYYGESSERDFVLAALCDGMGGMARGEDAAILALSTFVSRVIRHGRTPPEERLERAARTADEVVYGAVRGGGATLTAALIERGGTATAINIGDSRLYQVSDDELRQLSRDDTLGEYLKSENGGVAADERRHQILQYVGIGQGMQPHLLSIQKLGQAKDEMLLLTSDGAHDVPDEILARVVKSAKSGAELVRRLLSLAELMGGFDNATVVALPRVPFGDRPASGTDAGMTFRLWSPFAELEIWIPASMERSAAAPSPVGDRDPALRPSSDELKSRQKGRKTTRSRRSRKSNRPTAEDEGDTAAPRLDIDFPKGE